MTDTITTEQQEKRFDLNRDYLVGNNFLSSKECDQILSDAADFKLMPATLADMSVSTLVRDCKFAFFDRDEKWGWVYDRIQDFITLGNDRYFKFDIIGFEPIQFVVYDTVGSHYELHIDSGNEYRDSDLVRKLSFTIQLTDPDEYQGCDLEFFRSVDNYVAAARSRGSITVSSSFVPHRVTPLETGTRAAIVGWIYGPPFR